MYTVERLIKALEMASEDEVKWINEHLSSIEQCIQMSCSVPLNAGACLVNHLVDLLKERDENDRLEKELEEARRRKSRRIVALDGNFE